MRSVYTVRSIGMTIAMSCLGTAAFNAMQQSLTVAGEAGGDFVIARLISSGVLDTTFSPGGLDGSGVSRFNISGTDSIHGMALQGDSKIITVGVAGADFAVARLTSAGLLDSTFSPGGLDGNGVLRFNIAGTDLANAVAIQSDGKIVVAGEAGGDFAVARLTSSGALDATFSPGGLDGNGILRFNISGTDSIRSVALQADGKIVVVGVAGDDFALARLTTSGALDASFSSGGTDGSGVLRLNIGGADSANAVAIQPDGRVVVAGEAAGDFAIARTTSAGALDATFSPGGVDGNGVLRLNVSGLDAAYGLKLQSDGKIVVAGSGGADFVVVRLVPSGALDSAFSAGGIDGSGVLRLNISGTDLARALTLQADGKIVVAGEAAADFAVARLTSSGVLDTTFSPGGLDGNGVFRFNIGGTDSARAVISSWPFTR